MGIIDGSWTSIPEQRDTSARSMGDRARSQGSNDQEARRSLGDTFASALRDRNREPHHLPIGFPVAHCLPDSQCVSIAKRLSDTERHPFSEPYDDVTAPSVILLSGCQCCSGR